MRNLGALNLMVAIVLFGAYQTLDAQQTMKSMPRIGFIYSTGTPESPQPLFESFRQGLQKLGYVEGKNILLERRYAEGRLDQMPALVKQLVQKKVDVIVAINNVLIKAAKNETKTIPIVMLSSVDPVEEKYIESFARPGGNVTGIAWLSRDLSAKRMELLKELFPRLSKIGVLWDGDAPGPAVAMKEYEVAGRAFKVEIASIKIHGPEPDLVAAYQIANTARADAVIAVGNALMFRNAKEISNFAIKNRFPLMTEQSRYVNAGSLVSYGASLSDIYRRAAGYVVEILKGGKPSTMVVQQATEFELHFNLKTAKQLGIEIPRPLLLRATEVVE